MAITILKEVFGVWAFVWRIKHALSTNVCIQQAYVESWVYEASSGLLKQYVILTSGLLKQYVILTRYLWCSTMHLSVSDVLKETVWLPFCPFSSLWLCPGEERAVQAHNGEGPPADPEGSPEQTGWRPNSTLWPVNAGIHKAQATALGFTLSSVPRCTVALSFALSSVPRWIRLRLGPLTTPAASQKSGMTTDRSRPPSPPQFLRQWGGTMAPTKGFAGGAADLAPSPISSIPGAQHPWPRLNPEGSVNTLSWRNVAEPCLRAEGQMQIRDKRLNSLCWK